MSKDDELDPLGPAAQGRPAGADYDVGYRKPPPHGRFKKGRSGNPKGAPKQVINLVISFNAMLAETDVTASGGRVMSKVEAMARALVYAACKCEQKAFSKFLRLLKRAGLLEPPAQQSLNVGTARAGFLDMTAFQAEFGKPLPAKQTTH